MDKMGQVYASGGGQAVHVNKYAPCPICGKTDWCIIVTYPNGDVVYLCHRTEGTKGDRVVGADGRTFICTGETDGGFTKWQEVSQYERFLDSLKAKRGGKGSKNHTYRDVARKSTVPNYSDLPVEGVAEVASPARLDEVYRTFLELLVLEDKHVKKLKKEWDKVVDGKNVYAEIMNSQYKDLIKSIPPEDFLRYSSGEQLKNSSRKQIMEDLIAKVGEPVGVPGFYQRHSDGKWTFFRLSGIAYPSCNSRGQIRRIRVNDDYPAVDGVLNGKEGTFRYQKDKVTNEVGWYFLPADKSAPTLVWQYGSPQNLISLNWKGYPPGKVSGKYKNFSSYSEQLVDDGKGGKKRVNYYTNGCQSGSPVSLFIPPEADNSMVICTEGEKKALVAAFTLHSPAIAYSGVADFAKPFVNEEGYETSLIDEMVKAGAELFVLIYDADKNENKMVLQNEKKAVQEFLDRGLPIAIGQWNENWGKGLDDVLLEGVKPKIMLIS